MDRGQSQQGYFWKLGILSLAYLLIESFYSHYALFSLDDFWLAYQNLQYKNSLPYRDFLPYKTVLGYYVFLLPLSFFQGIFSPLIYTKIWIAGINTFFIVGISLWLKKFYSPKAILTSLLFIIPTQLFICFSCEIRVDLLAFWLCLIAVLFLFDERFFFAGLCLGISFLISQKALYYFIASNGGLLVTWFVNQRQWRMMKNILMFNIASFFMLGAYLIFWAHLSSFSTVITSVFYEPYLISSVNWYLAFKQVYWLVIINANPGITLLWPFAFFALFLFRIKNRAFILTYATVILFFILTAKQPFPYFLLLAMPALLLVSCAFFSALYQTSELSSLLRRNKKSIDYFCFFYTLTLLLICYYFTLLPVYYFVVLLPSLFYLSLFGGFHGYLQAFFTALFFLGIFLISIILPFLTFLKLSTVLDGRYQKSMVYLTNALLREGGSYVAGVPLLSHVAQPVPGLVHIVGPTLEYLKHPTPKLSSIAHLSSLYFSPATTQQIIESMNKAPVKLYVDNLRIHLLPRKLQHYLATQFAHFWGNIYLYAPQIPPGIEIFQIKFAGPYRVKAAENAIIYINHQKVTPNQTLYLFSSQYRSEANSPYRLKLQPVIAKNLLQKRFKENRWQQFIY